VRLIPLGSGSKGNATLVELGSLRLLVDAGLSAKVLEERLSELSIEPGRIDAILLSHEHEDHARGVERFSRRHGTPVACSIETLEALDLSPIHLGSWIALGSQPLDLGSVRVETFPVPHDAVRPVGFVLHGEGLRVGIVTDLGHVTRGVVERLRGCEILMLEFNHDDRMLREGAYPWSVKQRVSGRLGHLSNEEAGALLREIVDQRCRFAVLAHLSEQNNTPTLARRSATAALRDLLIRPEISIAAWDRPTVAVEL
jgi:phosphoribosyl 1,2-cyclic phosphodiesterase